MSLDQALPGGFQWAAATAGIKASGRSDLAVAVAVPGTTAAALFTRNQVVAAPVIVGREHLRASNGELRAIVINAGNANCATGSQGLSASRATCEQTAALLGCSPPQVLPSSTGIIGVLLPIKKLLAALPAAIENLGKTSVHAEAFATAILTTDTRMKTAQGELALNGKTVRLFGCCKGAGMIGPDLGPPHATMLVYLFTDLGIPATELQTLLTPAVETTFNCIAVDGDTSTNDTVLLLASGTSGARWMDANTTEQTAFRTALHELCGHLAHSIIDDGEGVTHVVTLEVTGAPTDAAARQIARTIATSPLCKTAWSSADPNWGRILAAAGRAGVPFDIAEISITIAGLPVFERGARSALMDEAAVHTRMRQRHYEIAVEIGNGAGRCRFITCDLTAEYVHINADYST